VNYTFIIFVFVKYIFELKNTTQSENRQTIALNLENFVHELIVESPGRINLIGEHIDYNGGHVLPAAIDKKIKFYLKRNNTRKCNVWSKNFDNGFSFSIDDVGISNVEWENYILGVIHYIDQIYPGSIHGFDCIVESELPMGSGLSSSAALECGIATGLNNLFAIGLTKDEIIHLSRDAEHNYVGTKCGIMDQFTVVRGQKDRLILLNCQNLEYRMIQADLEPYHLVLLNSNVSHNLASSEYNNRREDCEAALAIIEKDHPNYHYLVDVPEDVLKSFKEDLTPTMFDRAAYVIQENRRTQLAAEALEKGFFEEFGRLLFESHHGLRNNYEVSCEELDFMVDYAKTQKGVLGARMMGGGFGGCTINVVHKDEISSYIERISIAYRKQFGIDLTPIEVSISDAVEVIK